MIRKGLKSLFRRFLMLFLYLKKNLVKLGGLLILGIILGIALNFIFEKKLMSEVIVKPNFESKDYLYTAVNELQSNIKAKDTSFFYRIGISLSDLKDFELVIEPIQEEENDKKLEEDMKYLELLQNFKDKNFAVDVIKSELFKKSVINHKLIFSFKNYSVGKENIKKVLGYLNSNSHFNNLREVAIQNMQSRIEKNSELIAQIDELIANYSKGLVESDNVQGGNKVYLESEGGLNVPGLLALKNRLTTEMEEKKMELVTNQEVIKIINIGNSQIVQKPFFNRGIVLVPLGLIGMFFFFSFLQYLNKKALDLNLQ